MAVTTSSSLSNSVKPFYDADYELATQGKQYWLQLLWNKLGRGMQVGDRVEFVFYDRLDPATTALTQTSDVTPVAMGDAAVQLVLSEYGNAVQQSLYLRATAYTDVERAAAEAVGYNAAESLDMIARQVAIQGTQVVYAAGSTRLGLVRGNKATVAFFNNLKRVAHGRRCPSFPDGSYLSVVHTNVIYDLVNDSILQAIGVYSEPSIIFNGEVGKVAGVRLLESPTGGKAFFGAGATDQAATTLNGAVVAGATDIVVASATGIAVGDRLTIGTVESAGTSQPLTEEVEVTAVNGTTITVRGDGNKEDNLGLRYAHANGAAVTEAANVYGIPIIGPKSIGFAYSDVRGPHGEIVLSGPFDTLGRLYNTGWHAIIGIGILTQRWVIRGECSGTY